MSLLENIPYEDIKNMQIQTNDICSEQESCQIIVNGIDIRMNEMYIVQNIITPTDDHRSVSRDF